MFVYEVLVLTWSFSDYPMGSKNTHDTHISKITQSVECDGLLK